MDKISPTKYKMYNKPIEVKVFPTHDREINQRELVPDMDSIYIEFNIR